MMRLVNLQDCLRLMVALIHESSLNGVGACIDSTLSREKFSMLRVHAGEARPSFFHAAKLLSNLLIESVMCYESLIVQMH